MEKLAFLHCHVDGRRGSRCAADGLLRDASMLPGESFLLKSFLVSAFLTLSLPCGSAPRHVIIHLHFPSFQFHSLSYYVYFTLSR